MLYCKCDNLNSLESHEWQISYTTVVYNCLLLFQTGNTETCSKKIDLAIILDASASIGEDTFNLSKDFAKTLLRRFTISPDNARVSIVAYSQHINIQSRFSDDQDEGKLEEILGNTFYEGSSTGTGKTMQAVNFEVFLPKSASRIGNPGKQVMVKSTRNYCEEDSFDDLESADPSRMQDA